MAEGDDEAYSSLDEMMEKGKNYINEKFGKVSEEQVLVICANNVESK